MSESSTGCVQAKEVEVGKSELTVTPRIQIHNIANPYIYNSKKALILFLELLLVKYLDCENAIFGDSPSDVSIEPHHSRCDFVLHVEALVPVWVQSLLDHTRRPGLLSIDRGDGKRIWKACDLLVGLASSLLPEARTEDISFVQAISRDN